MRYVLPVRVWRGAEWLRGDRVLYVIAVNADRQQGDTKKGDFYGEDWGTKPLYTPGSYTCRPTLRNLRGIPDHPRVGKIFAGTGIPVLPVSLVYI